MIARTLTDSAPFAGLKQHDEQQPLALMKDRKKRSCERSWLASRHFTVLFTLRLRVARHHHATAAISRTPTPSFTTRKKKG